MNDTANIVMPESAEPESGAAVRVQRLVRAPFYSDEWVTLYHGDAREIVPMLQADALVSDKAAPELTGVSRVGSKDGLERRARTLAKYKRYRAKNKAKQAAYMKMWRMKNAKHRAEYQQKWKAKQPKQYWKRWAGRENEKANGRWPNGGRTPAETLKANRDLRRQQCQKISDSYLRGWMSRTTGYVVKPSEWPSDLVEAKRAQLKLTRLCRASRTTLN